MYISEEVILIKYIKITQFDTANGPGIRTVLWVSGCSHLCKGCHNPETWDASKGTEFTEDTIFKILESLSSNYISGLTVSGGDPLYPGNRASVRDLVTRVRAVYPKKSIWLYTGYEYEEIVAQMAIDDTYYLASIMKCIDVLVEGRFILDKRDISLPYCGSTNQRVIDVKKTLQLDEIVLYEENNYDDRRSKKIGRR